MYRETGVRFEYQPGQSNCESYPSVLFIEGYPWTYNDIEKELTEEKLDKICKKYINELNTDMTPDYLEMEYYR